VPTQRVDALPKDKSLKQESLNVALEQELRQTITLAVVSQDGELQGQTESNDANHPLLSGSVIERWEILERLGVGGMSAVYKARHKLTGQLAAIKILLPQHSAKPESLMRFQSEAKAISKLDHPHIIGLNDCGRNEDGQIFVIMDFADGETLAKVLERDGILSLERALPIFLQVTEALAHAHKRGIIHRDLKPSNIMLSSRQDYSDYVKLVDFGIAKLIHAPANADAEVQRLTATGEVFGSPLYMSPEQYQGKQPDERSDIYSMGCLMYEAVTGSPPFIGKNPLETLYKHVTETPKPIVVSPDSEVALKRIQKVVFKCLAKNPNDRYQSMQELREDIKLVGRNLDVAVRPIYRKERPRFGLMQMVSTCFVLVLIAGALCRVCLNGHTEPLVDKAIDKSASSELDERQFAGMTLNQLNEAIEQGPDSAQMYFDRGCLYLYERDDRPNAVRDFDRAIALAPVDAAPAYAERASAHAMMSQFETALADANKAIEIDPSWAGSFSERAHVENLMEQYSKALSDSQLACSLDLSAPSVLSEQAFALNGMGDYQGSIDWYTSSLGCGETPFAYAMRGLAKFHQRQFDAAISDEQKALELQPSYSPARMLLAFALSANGGSPETTNASIDRAMKEDNLPARAHRLRAELHRYKGEYQNAISEYGRAIALDPGYFASYRQRGISYSLAGEVKNALADLLRAVELNPESSSSLSYLAVVEEKLGHHADADKHMDEAFACSTITSECYSNLAIIRFIRGEIDLALDNARRAISLNSFNSDALNILGQIHTRLGDRDNGGSFLSQALQYGYPNSTPQIGW